MLFELTGVEVRIPYTRKQIPAEGIILIIAINDWADYNQRREGKQWRVDSTLIARVRLTEARLSFFVNQSTTYPITIV